MSIDLLQLIYWVYVWVHKIDCFFFEWLHDHKSLHRIQLIQKFCSKNNNANQQKRVHYTHSKTTSLASNKTKTAIQNFTPDLQINTSSSTWILVSLAHKHEPSITLRSSSKHLLVVPKSKNKLYDRSFSVAAPTEWNILPENLKLIDNVNGIKSKLKTFLFQEYYC